MKNDEDERRGEWVGETEWRVRRAQDEGREGHEASTKGIRQLLDNMLRSRASTQQQHMHQREP